MLYNGNLYCAARGAINRHLLLLWLEKSTPKTDRRGEMRLLIGAGRELYLLWP